MTKTIRITYWVSTIWLSLGMVSSAIVQLIKLPEEVDMITRLGYPLYFLTLLAFWKILGVITVLVPKLPLIKEWAYAGFTFNFISAAVSHAVVDGFGGLTVFPLVALVLLAVSYLCYQRILQTSKTKYDDQHYLSMPVV